MEEDFSCYTFCTPPPRIFISRDITFVFMFAANTSFLLLKQNVLLCIIAIVLETSSISPQINSLNALHHLDYPERKLCLLE